MKKTIFELYLFIALLEIVEFFRKEKNIKILTEIADSFVSVQQDKERK